MAGDIKEWVADDIAELTEVTEPIMIDYAAADLYPYIPELGSKFKLEAKTDVDGTEYAQATAFTGNWSEEMKVVMKKLKMRLKSTDGGIEFLEDDDPDLSNIQMNGWKITNWKLTRALNVNGKQRNVDIVTWERDGVFAETYMGWFPYRHFN